MDNIGQFTTMSEKAMLELIQADNCGHSER